MLGLVAEERGFWVGKIFRGGSVVLRDNPNSDSEQEEDFVRSIQIHLTSFELIQILIF